MLCPQCEWYRVIEVTALTSRSKVICTGGNLRPSRCTC